MTHDKLKQEISEDMFLEDLQSSLDDFLMDNKENRVKKRYTKIKSAPVYSSTDIKRIRKKYNYSQKTLASILNVSVRTVENWEISKAKPNGSVFRLLELLEKNNFIEDILVKETVK